MIALLANTSEVERMVFVKPGQNYRLSKFNEITQHKFSFHMRHKPIILSSPEPAFSFDFYKTEAIQKGSKILELTASEDGMCAGVIQWIKVNLYDEIKYENNPTQMYKEPETASGWMTPIYRFDKPTFVKRGQVVEINATLFDDSVWFSEFKK